MKESYYCNPAICCFLFILFSVSGSVHGRHDHGQLMVPCFFIFGASSFDNGNNNALPTLAKANYLRMGSTSLQGQRGAEFLGFDDYIPSFASTVGGENILKGVNYASGGSGIRAETGQHAGARISMDGQLRNHQITVLRLINRLGQNESAAKEYLNKCIYAAGLGTNDYVSNYFLPSLYPTSRIYTPEQYALVLAQQYSRQLKTLYTNYGARKVALFGLAQLGCAPSVVASKGATNGSACVDYINDAVQIFNNRLKELVNELNRNLTDAKFIYVNVYEIASEATSYPSFRVIDAPCCPVASNNTLILCTINQTPCPNRDEYLYWDALHLSEATNMFIANRSYNAQSPTDTCPIDISHLAKL
ncbi:GDSL esterase/lipase [Vitis vinifera]|uniref:GDSL esterase/lipase n=1 Tax=Vitis vinifera TaxID=29760 RepID=A0A438J4F8_VITVI|nr:GDSL esterase/lipase [Vitis vinifera]